MEEVKTSIYGKRLDPRRGNRINSKALAERSTVKIDQGGVKLEPDANFTINLPLLARHIVIAPGTLKLTFDLNVENGLPVNNVSRNIIKQMTVSYEGSELLSINNYHILHSWMDQWLPRKLVKDICQRRGFFGGTQFSENCLKLRLGQAASGATSDDKLFAKTYGKRFEIPIDFELFRTTSPFYQSGLSTSVNIGFNFRSSREFIKDDDTSDTDLPSYNMDRVRLEYECVKSEALANAVHDAYNEEGYSLLYDYITNFHNARVNSKDTSWNFSYTQQTVSLKGILILAKKDSDLHNPDTFWNIDPENIEVTVEGCPNKLHAKGIKLADVYPETKRFFSGLYRGTRSADSIIKEGDFHGMDFMKFYKSCFGIWLDFRFSDDNYLHEDGLKMKTVGSGVAIHILRKPDANDFNGTIHMFAFKDGLMDISQNNISSRK